MLILLALLLAAPANAAVGPQYVVSRVAIGTAAADQGLPLISRDTTSGAYLVAWDALRLRRPFVRQVRTAVIDRSGARRGDADRPVSPISQNAVLTGLAYQPVLGRHLAVWRHSAGGGQVWARVLDPAGVPVGGAVRLADGTGAAVSSDPVGGGWIVAYLRDGTVYTRRYDGTTLGAETPVAGNASGPIALAADTGAGGALVAYASQGSVYAARLDGTPPVLLAETAEQASLAFDPIGARWVAAFRHEGRLAVRVVSASGTPGPLLPTGRGYEVTGRPSVVVLPEAAEAIVAFDRGEIQAVRVALGEPRIGRPYRVSASFSRTAAPALAFDPDLDRILYAWRGEGRIPGRYETWARLAPEGVEPDARPPRPRIAVRGRAVTVRCAELCSVEARPGSRRVRTRVRNRGRGARITVARATLLTIDVTDTQGNPVRVRVRIR